MSSIYLYGDSSRQKVKGDPIQDTVYLVYAGTQFADTRFFEQKTSF